MSRLKEQKEETEERFRDGFGADSFFLGGINN